MKLMLKEENYRKSNLCWGLKICYNITVTDEINILNNFKTKILHTFITIIVIMSKDYDNDRTKKEEMGEVLWRSWEKREMHTEFTAF